MTPWIAIGVCTGVTIVLGIIAKHKDVYGPGEWAGIPWYAATVLMGMVAVFIALVL